MPAVAVGRQPRQVADVDRHLDPDRVEARDLEQEGPGRDHLARLGVDVLDHAGGRRRDRLRVDRARLGVGGDLGEDLAAVLGGAQVRLRQVVLRLGVDQRRAAAELVADEVLGAVEVDLGDLELLLRLLDLPLGLDQQRGHRGARLGREDRHQHEDRLPLLDRRPGRGTAAPAGALIVR